MGLQTVALYGLEVPAGDIIIPAALDFPATFRITMAAIDPSAPADLEATNGSTVSRSTLKLVRQSISPSDDDSEEDSDENYMRALLAGSDSGDSDEGEDEDEEANGGPSDPAKSKKAQKAAALEKLLNSVDKESDDEMENSPNGINGVKKSDKGKAKATEAEGEDDEEDESEGSEDEEDLELDEFVICTLDPEKTYQQPLDITIGKDERVFFKVSGTHAIHLTGNYVIPDDHGHNRHHEVYDSDDSDDEDYDLPPDEDELEAEDDESDELDALEDPRITEVDSEEEVPKLVTKSEKREVETEKKGKNKRAAVELEEEEEEGGETLDDIIAKSAKPAETAKNDEPKLSKRQLKRMKKNNGQAIATKADEVKKIEPAKETPSTRADKKVQFAKDLEQGPTGFSSEAKSKADTKGETKAELSSEAKPKGETKSESRDVKPKATLGARIVNGVEIDDKKLGQGPAAKKGDVVGMRYIGKLTDGKVFDSNKKGAPFSFKLGVGEVIKGWDIGVAGMSIGGERRIKIPAHLAYGSKATGGIPANSTLVFDIKMLEIK